MARYNNNWGEGVCLQKLKIVVILAEHISFIISKSSSSDFSKSIRDLFGRKEPFVDQMIGLTFD